MVFAVPSLVFAQTYIAELSQECDFALVGTEHTITAKVTDGGAPAADVQVLFWINDGPNTNFFDEDKSAPLTDQDGIATFTYTGSSADFAPDVITFNWVKPDLTWVHLAEINTTWTANEADLCSDSPGVTVGGRLTLNARKHGALKIAVCGADDLDVSNVDPETVRLAGVEPWHWKQKDSRLCPDGKDGLVDLVLKFKNREVVEALEKDFGKELVDGDKDVPLALTGELHDGTPFGGEWTADIKKKDKRHGKKKHYQKKDKKNKGSKK